MSEEKSDYTIIHFDGAAEPTNPGPASCAAVIDLPSGESVTVAMDLGKKHKTNNYAEYSGLITGLEKALSLGCTKIEVFGDSQLVIYQLTGKYQVKNKKLEQLYYRAKKLLSKFEEYKLNWIPRTENGRADAAAGEILKAKLPPTIEIPDNLPVPEPREGLEEIIKQLRLKGQTASFKEWLNLKSGGNDEFSFFKGKALAIKIPESVRDAIDAALFPEEKEDEKFLDIVYRWYLRGLPPALALKKCRVDTEVSTRAEESRRIKVASSPPSEREFFRRMEEAIKKEKLSNAKK